MSNKKPNTHPFPVYPIVQNVVSFAEMELEGDLNLKYIAEKV